MATAALLTAEQEAELFDKLITTRAELADKLWAIEGLDAAFGSYYVDKVQLLTPSAKFEAVIDGGGAATLKRISATDKQLTRLFQKWETTRSRIADANVRLVFAVIHRGRWLANSDYSSKVSAGMLGLLRAIDKFNCPGDRRFSTYAVPWIKNTIHTELAGERLHVREPAHVHSQRTEFLKTKATLSAAFGREATVDEVLTVLPQFSRHDVELWSLRQVSGQKEVGSADEDGKRTVEDGLPAVGWQPDEVVQLVLDSNEHLAKVKQLVELLPQRQKYIIEQRFGLTGGEERTTADIGEELGLSVQRVSQLTQIALGTMNRGQ